MHKKPSQTRSLPRSEDDESLARDIETHSSFPIVFDLPKGSRVSVQWPKVCLFLRNEVNFS